MSAALFSLAFLTSVAWWPQTIDGPLTTRWAVLAIGVPICLLLARRTAPFPWLPAAFVAVAALSLTWTTDFLGGIDEVSHLVILFAAFWLGSSIDNSRSTWLGLAAGVGVSALFAVPQTFGWDFIPQAAAPAGLFSNRNFFGEACMVGLIASLMMNYWVLTAILAVGVLLAGSKAVFGALVLTLAFWFVPRRLWVACGLLGSLTLLGVVLLAGATIPSAAVRFEIWKPALANLTFFGHGISSFMGTYPVAEHAHSDPIQLVYELGIFAAIPALIVYRSMEGWSYATELEALVVVAVAGVALFSFPTHLPLTAFAFAVAAGRLTAHRHTLGQFGYEGRVASFINPRRKAPFVPGGDWDSGRFDSGLSVSSHSSTP